MESKTAGQPKDVEMELENVKLVLSYSFNLALS